MAQEIITPQLNSTWLITFADLITLIMCSFILFFAIRQNHVTKIGTEVAELKVGSDSVGSQKEQLFYANDVVEKDGSLTNESIKVVKKLVESANYAKLEASVLICSSKYSEGFASNLVRVLEETGLRNENVDVGFFGTPCTEVTQDLMSKEHQLVGIINIKGF
jgi:hypothetical protein